MPQGHPCPQRPLVDAHFDGHLSPRRERALRLHLPGCADCRGYYGRHMVLAGLSPLGLDDRTRLGRGLGLLPQRRLAPLILAAALVIILLAGPALLNVIINKEGAFTERGTAPGASTLLVYRIQRGNPPTLAQGEIQASDELAFAYENPGRQRLLIFGVDDHGRVYWYFPAWQDARQNPQAVPIRGERGLHELTEAISHPLEGGMLWIHALFTDQPLTVRQVEGLVAGLSSPGDALPLPEALQEALPLRVIVKAEGRGR